MIRVFVLPLLFVFLLTGSLAVADAAPQKKAGRKPAAQRKGPKKKDPGKPNADFRTVLARLDKDRNQELTFAEFTAGLTAVQKKRAKAVFDSMQDELDPESVGRKTISRDELRTHFKKYQQLRGGGSGAASKGKKAPGKAAAGKGKPKQKKPGKG